jgi:hypothetical protein
MMITLFIPVFIISYVVFMAIGLWAMNRWGGHNGVR